ncbi:hypothetical protein [Pengzhenrongella sp.]|uniref:hypothetical protein n=1 Tax=Pengzhenrongella sp. TaxID=2888820 RepID=UPI002F94B5F2
MTISRQNGQVWVRSVVSGLTAAGRMAGDRRRGLITFGVLFAFYIYLAATSSPWWWAAAAAYLVVMSAAQLWWPRHQQRRADRLAAQDARA